jgi:hypothetical protein
MLDITAQTSFIDPGDPDCLISSFLDVHTSVVAVCIVSQHDFGLNDIQLVTLYFSMVTTESH